MEKDFGSTGFISSGIRHLTPREALNCCLNGALILDVREEYMNRFKMFDVPEVIYCPYSILEETYMHLPSDRLMIIADAAGLHSHEATVFLSEKGFSDKIANLAGGLVEWERDEMPLVTDKSERLSGSCMCQLRPREKGTTDAK